MFCYSQGQHAFLSTFSDYEKYFSLHDKLIQLNEETTAVITLPMGRKLCHKWANQ
jgi:hypothetical protein